MKAKKSIPTHTNQIVKRPGKKKYLVGKEGERVRKGGNLPHAHQESNYNKYN